LRFAALVAFALAYLTVAVAHAQSDREVVVGRIDGIINPVTASYVDRVLTDAERANAPAVVFDANASGGLADALGDINLRIARANVPVLVYGSADASNALHSNVGSYVATDVPDLLRQADGASVQVASGPRTLHTANAPTRSADMSAIETFLHTITDPTVAYILLSMGSLLLLLELFNPGSIFPGVIGGICVALALYALGRLPLNFTGVALLGFGLLLFALEPFLTSHGILAVGGAIAFAMGSLLLINAPDAPFLHISGFAIAAVTVVMIGFFGFLVGAVIRARRRRPVTGHEGLVGATGIVRRDIERGRLGIVLVLGELWRATASEGRLSAGEQITVQSVDGLVLSVRRASGVAPAPPRPAAPAAAKSKLAGQPRDL
jgi:membrane-bound serine protease (ClpP class)